MKSPSMVLCYLFLYPYSFTSLIFYFSSRSRKGLSLNHTFIQIKYEPWGIEQKVFAHPLITVCPYTFISLILCSIMIEQGLSPQPPFRWVMGLEPNGIWLTSPQSLPPFWAEPTSAWEVILNQ